MTEPAGGFHSPPPPDSINQVTTMNTETETKMPTFAELRASSKVSVAVVNRLNDIDEWLEYASDHCPKETDSRDKAKMLAMAEKACNMSIEVAGLEAWCYTACVDPGLKWLEDLSDKLIECGVAYMVEALRPEIQERVKALVGEL